jgi:STE24 endopeptidase
MRIFHANWWIPIAVLGVFYIIVPRELMALKNPTWKPIENPILVERLTGFIERGNVKVKIKNILRMDADKPPAGVAGLLLPKRILFSNSILQRFSIPELEAVFAHELGHVKTGFVQKKFLVQSVLIFVRLYLANLIYGILLPVYGFSGPEQIAALPLLAFCWLILGLPVRAIQSSVSQYFERKADQYAISEVGESLFSSTFDKILETRQEQTLSPIFNFVCYAHPCREERMHISRHKNSEEGKDESF